MQGNKPYLRPELESSFVEIDKRSAECYNALEKPLRFAFPKNLEFARKLEDGGNKGEELSLARGKCARKVLLESLPEIARVRLPPLRLCLIMVESPDKGVKWT